MKKKLGRMAPEVFKRDVGCTAGELRLLKASPLTSYRLLENTFDADAARAALDGIRLARASLGL